MTSVQNHREHFSRVPEIHIQRSTFDRSQGVKTTFDPGKLIPLKVQEIIPGDTIVLNTSLFVRTLTNIVPYMDNLYLDIHSFFSPNRLVWDNWEKFMGQQDNPGDSTDFTIPQVEINTQTGTLADYFGISFNNPLFAYSVNSLPFRHYSLIWNEWYRDEDLQDSVLVPKDNGPDPLELARFPLPRAKRHDYFTSARPRPQKGPDVLIPMGADAPVAGNNSPFKLEPGNLGASPRRIGMNADGTMAYESPTGVGSWAYADQDGDTGLIALTAEIGGTINQLREAEAIQVLLERDMRGGTRYIEMLRSQYGVTNPDFRLQRPELIAQSTVQVQVAPVPQTSSSNETTPQGNLAGNSIASSRNAHSFTHSFTEHGYLFILVSARADLNYQQGLEKMWTREKRFDFYIPALANLGEQPILNQEIYFSSLDLPRNTLVFGYNEAWADYRYGYNHVTGKMRADAIGSLKQWNLAQYFEDAPVLNDEFIVENPPIDRILAVEPDNDAFFGDFWFNIKHTRPMPVFSIPGWSRSL